MLIPLFFKKIKCVDREEKSLTVISKVDILQRQGGDKINYIYTDTNITRLLNIYKKMDDIKGKLAYTFFSSSYNSIFIYLIS